MCKSVCPLPSHTHTPPLSYTHSKKGKCLWLLGKSFLIWEICSWHWSRSPLMRSKAILATVTARGMEKGDGGRKGDAAYGKCRKMASKSAAKRQRKLKIAIVTMLTICRRQSSGTRRGERQLDKQTGLTTSSSPAPATTPAAASASASAGGRKQRQGERGDTYNQYEIYAIFIAANGSFSVLTFLANNAGSVCVCVYEGVDIAGNVSGRLGESCVAEAVPILIFVCATIAQIYLTFVLGLQNETKQSLIQPKAFRVLILQLYKFNTINNLPIYASKSCSIYIVIPRLAKIAINLRESWLRFLAL